jgi:Holliday junction resolvase
MGYEGEYYLMKKFVSLGRPGYYAVRTPGSGTGKTYKPDLLAVDDGELCALEVKSTNRDRIYVRPEQLERLLGFVELFRVKCPHCGGTFTPKPILAVRFLGRGWVFQEVSGSGTLYVSRPGLDSGSPRRDIRGSGVFSGHDAAGEEVPDSWGDKRDRPRDREALRTPRREARTRSAEAADSETAGGGDIREGG